MDNPSMRFPRINKLHVSILLIVVLVGSTLGLYVLLYQRPSISRASSYPLVITDDLGRNVSISHVPKKIVSLVPSATEIVFAVGEGDKVVGVTRYDNKPPELVQRVRTGNITIVGGGYDPDIEKIVALGPDLIMVGLPAEVPSEVFNKLQGLGFTLMALDAKSIEGVLRDISIVGKVFGNTAQAQQLLSSMSDKMKSITSKTASSSKPNVFIENWPDPLFSVGQSTLQDDMVRTCGGSNIFSDLTGSAQVNAEAVISRNPAVIITFDNQTANDLSARAGWSNINAVRNQKVFQMTGYEGAPNPMVVDSLEKMCGFIHPDLFGSQQSLEPLQYSIPQLPIGVVRLGQKD
jgi:iron complex transport system substrate-binding protein